MKLDRVGMFWLWAGGDALARACVHFSTLTGSGTLLQWDKLQGHHTK